MKCFSTIAAVFFFASLASKVTAKPSSVTSSPIVILLMTYKHKSQLFRTSAVYTGKKIFTAAHSIKTCPSPCTTFDLAIYDKSKQKLVHVGYIDRKLFETKSMNDVASTRFQLPALPLESFSDPVNRCLSFSMLPGTQSSASRLKNNELIDGLDVPKRGLGNLIALFNRDGALEKPGAQDGGSQEIENTRSRTVVYFKTQEAGLYYVETLFPPLAQFVRTDSIVRAPCAGWFGSSGGAFLQGSILGIISGPATKFVASIRPQLDYGDLNASVVEL